MLDNPIRDKAILGGEKVCFPQERAVEARAFAYHAYVSRQIMDRKQDMTIEWVAYAGRAWAAAFSCP